jgi:hypothetical protein
VGYPFHAVILAAKPARKFGDFTHCKNHNTHQQTLDRLLRDLRVEQV